MDTILCVDLGRLQSGAGAPDNNYQVCFGVWIVLADIRAEIIRKYREEVCGVNLETSACDQVPITSLTESQYYITAKTTFHQYKSYQ